MCSIVIIVMLQVDPLVSLMMVEKVPDSTYEMIGGLDKQIKEIKEVCNRVKSMSKLESWLQGVLLSSSITMS